jgi:tetratricopeptide (TPR) repeat protein
LPVTDREKADFILGYIHRTLLKSYSLNQTGVDTIFVNGRYNCVSSAVLYTILCKSAGLDVSGVVTRDHSFVTVRIGNETIDVETTTPYGFDPGNRREFHDQFGRVTGFAYVPARNYRDRQAITPVELVSLIISNRISALEAGNRFSEAVPLAADRAALLSGVGMATGPDTSADSPAALFENPRQHLLDRLFNYGASLLRSGKEEDCIRWAALAAPLYPDEKKWPELTSAAVNNRITKYLRSGQFTDAGNFLAANRDALNTTDFAQFDTLIVDGELLNAANRIRNVSDGDNVINAIDQALSNGRISDSRARELLTFSVQKTASILSAPPGRDWLAAIHYIENAVARFGPNRELEQSLQNYRVNRATEFHNRFATAWNRRNFDEARRVLNEGLTEFPADRQLLADMEMMNRNRR